MTLYKALIWLTVIFLCFAAVPPVPQRLAVNWQWLAAAALVAAFYLVSK